MQYRIDKKTNNKLSILGFGCMRFPNDFNKTEELILHAIENGINYFDTAYIYGDSEKVLGKILKKNNLRDKVYIATKLPLFYVRKESDFDKYFDIQLKNLQTDYIDYYLMHMITDMDQWKWLCKLGIMDWIDKKKKEGKIKHIGFSFHGPQNEFLDIIDAYPWEFCLIQYNYLNENYQAGKKGMEKAYEKGITVKIMEPLLGGKLAVNIPNKVRETFNKADKNKTPVEWALKWLWNQKEPTVVLSGMSNMKELQENIKIASSSHVDMLSNKEINTIKKVVNIFNEASKINCTGCNYCMPCPKEVNIPAAFISYNTYYSIGKIKGLKDYMMSTSVTSGKKVSITNCNGCGICEEKCPQEIEIIKELKRVEKKIEPFWIKFIFRMTRFYTKKR